MSTKLFTAKLFTAKLLVAGLLTTVALGQAQAAPTSQDGTGPYAGIELARAHFGISSALPSTARDSQATGGRLYGGYRFTPNFGLEAGYAGLGSLSETVTVGGGAVTQDAKARSLYAAGTAQMPLTDALALRGKLGVSRGKVWGANQLPAANSLIGSSTSLMGGLGLDYRLNRDITLTADYSHYGHVSDKVRASSVGIGAKLAF